MSFCRCLYSDGTWLIIRGYPGNLISDWSSGSLDFWLSCYLVLWLIIQFIYLALRLVISSLIVLFPSHLFLQTAVSLTLEKYKTSLKTVSIVKEFVIIYKPIID